MKRFFSEMRSFLILWFGQLISQLGSTMTSFALLIWAYRQQGTVTSVALLTVCSYLPAALISLFAGPLIDRLPKKPVMLIADTAAAAMSGLTLFLFLTNGLRVAHLYLINVVLGLSGAFQGPASMVVVSALVPPEHYVRASGLQSLAGSLKDIIAPMLATAALAFGGLQAVLAVDLCSFAFAFITLCALKIPDTRDAAAREESFSARFRAGARFLREHRGVWRIIRYLMLINFIAAIAYYSILSPMILARTGGDSLQLGYVSSSVGLGMLAGALLTASLKPRMGKVTGMCLMYMLSFMLCDFPMGVGRTLWVWCAAAFLGNLPIPMGDARLQTLLRENVPVAMQGRVFATRNALVNLVVVIGYLLGGALADRVAEPLADAVPLLRALVGEGPGRAMGLVFVGTSLTGLLGSLSLWRDRDVRALENAGKQA